MRHVVLPAEHSETDLALAGQLVELLDSETLYVAWTHDNGPGAPSVEATITEEQQQPIGFLAALVTGLASLLRAIFSAPRQPVVDTRRITGEQQSQRTRAERS